ncbi:hypothetical protein EV175_000370 [Coemansia sp. RSA 1933]|nr:hypothetical protein EV175_000370 [Coemansia sp. RSA 1933]
MHQASQKHHKTLHSRFAELFPSFAMFKLLSLERVVLRVRPDDYFDNRYSSALQLCAISIARLAKEAGIYIAIASIVSHGEHGLAIDPVRLAAQLRIAVNSCTELVKVFGKIAEVKQLEIELCNKLTPNPSVYTTVSRHAMPLNSGPRVSINNAHFRRVGHSSVALRVGCLEACIGQVVAVRGPLKSGKTTLMMAILGELELLSGTSCVTGSLAYVCEHPWIMNGTVRENILFGKPFEKQRYGEVIRACCLESDFKRMERGDQTLAGDKGTTLSGGQQARIALARAVYAQAQIYVLDGLLAALDAHTRLSIWNNCDAIVDVNDGVVGIIRDMPARRPANVKESTVEKGKSYDTEAIATTMQQQPRKKPRPLRASPAGWENIYHFTNICGVGTLAIAALSGISLYVVPVLLLQCRNSTLDIDASEGSELDVMLESYARASSVYTAASISVDWVEYAIKELIYVALPRSRLHPALLDSIARASMTDLWSWNESVLRGIVRCAERATQIGLHGFVSDTGHEFAGIAHSFYSTATIVSAPALLVLLLGSVMIVYVFRPRVPALVEVQKYAAENRQRKEKATYDLFSGSLTVRVFDTYDYFGDEILEASELGITMQQLATSVLQTEALCRDTFEMFVTFVLVGMLQLEPKSAIGAGTVQSYYNILTDALPRIRYFTSFELNLVNHMLHLRDFGEAASMNPEESATTSRAKPGWPQGGRIVFKNCVMRYNAGAEPALNRTSFAISPGERIGVVGRSGAGKSSILLALMRIVELDSGAVTIDGVKTTNICLRDLRASIGVATQIHAILDGTLRSNVDPLGLHTDDEIHTMLKDAQLEGTFDDLDKQIAYGGANISSGERQLIGICRLLLQRYKIIVMDEATANIEADTARAINAIMSRHSRNCTVITISHRLETVMDSDRVLVMDNGAVVEAGEPNALAVQGGAFAKLLADEREQV